MDGVISQHRSLPREIRVAIIGAGAMGKGLFYQTTITPGIRCVAVADIDLKRARACVESMERKHRVVNTLGELDQAVDEGTVAICEDGSLPATSGWVDVLLESSNSIIPAAHFSVMALQQGKHLILMNSGIDLLFGPRFRELAEQNGVVYTSCDGDQPGVIKRLVGEVRFWGFDLVMAGNIKGFLDRYSNATTIVPEADKRGIGYKMATAFTDGTQLNIEMSLVANALGLSTVRPGMSGPRAKHVREAFDLFDFTAIRERGEAVVDYLLGAEPDGGVFVVAYCDHQYQRRMMEYYKMGRGPFYLFYRPYHLVHVEAMRCVAEAVLEKRALLSPEHGFQTNVYAYAKRPLRKREKLDGIGGYTCYGLIDNCRDQAGTPGLPICLSEDVVVTRDFSRDEKILMSDIGYDPDRFDFRLHSEALEASRKIGP